jgi:hypothetical protein
MYPFLFGMYACYTHERWGADDIAYSTGYEKQTQKPAVNTIKGASGAFYFYCCSSIFMTASFCITDAT